MAREQQGMSEEINQLHARIQQLETAVKAALGALRYPSLPAPAVLVLRQALRGEETDDDGHISRDMLRRFHQGGQDAE